MAINARMVVWAVLWLAMACARVLGVEVIAHRGASFDAPENSLTAFKLAWEQGADAIELDLWLSRDGRIIVFHDADTRRFELRSRKIASLTHAEAQQLDIGARKGRKFRGEGIPTLGAVLATVPAGKRAVLEVKCGAEILPELGRELGRSGLAAEQLAIISFDAGMLKASKEKFAQIEHYWLRDYKKDKLSGRMPELGQVVGQARAGGFEGVNLGSKWPIDAGAAGVVKAAGLKLLVWTLNDPVVARRLAEAGVEAITTDRPELIRRALGRD